MAEKSDPIDVRASKFLSLVLRHEPRKIGITLDEAGWVGVAELLDALARHGQAMSPEKLADVVANCPKHRFAFSEDRRKIRASQGHSVEVALGYAPADPPEVLYHGTAERSLEGIGREGLLKRSRHHVHLSATAETALQVGRRHGRPVVLRVKAGRMRREGHAFYVTPNGVWLVDAVPVGYIQFPEGSE